MTVSPTPPPAPAVPAAPSWFKRNAAKAKAWLESAKGRHVVTVVIVYVVTDLERRGYLPAIPIPKP